MVERVAGRMLPEAAAVSVEALATGPLSAVIYRRAGAVASAPVGRRDAAREIMRLEQVRTNLDSEILSLRRIMRQLVS